MLLPSKKDISEKLNIPMDQVRIGFYSTVGDLLHAGHLAAMREARNHCDYLIVGLIADPTTDRPKTKNAPIQSLLERYIELASCKYVDCVIPLSGERDLLDALLLLLPDVRFAGKEYENVPHTGSGIKDIKMVYLDRKHSFSSSELRQRVLLAEFKKVSDDSKESEDPTVL